MITFMNNMSFIVLHENIKIWKLKIEDRTENSYDTFFWTETIVVGHLVKII